MTDSMFIVFEWAYFIVMTLICGVLAVWILCMVWWLLFGSSR